MKFKLIALLVVVYLVTLVVYFPARIALSMVPIPQGVSIAQVDGTVWQGHIGKVVVDGRMLERIDWEVFPLALLTGRVATKVSIASTSQNPFSLDGYVNAGFNGVRVEDLLVQGELENTNRWLRIPDIIPVRGEYTLSLEEFIQGEPLCEVLNSSGRAFDVTTRIGQDWHRVGDYQVNLGCQDGKVLVNMPENNMLGIFFRLELDTSGYRLNGHLKPTMQAPSAIRDLLSAVGNPNSEGQYLFNAESP